VAGDGVLGVVVAVTLPVAGDGVLGVVVAALATR